MNLIQIVLKLLIHSNIDMDVIKYFAGTNETVKVMVDSEVVRKAILKALANKTSLTNCQVTSEIHENAWSVVTVERFKPRTLYLTEGSYANG